MIDGLSDLPPFPLYQSQQALHVIVSEVALTMSMIAFILAMAALGMAIYAFIRLSSLSRRVQRIVNRQERARQEAQAREKAQPGDTARPASSASSAPRAAASLTRTSGSPGAAGSGAAGSGAAGSGAAGSGVPGSGVPGSGAPASRSSGASGPPRSVPLIIPREEELKNSLQEIFRPDVPLALQTTHLHRTEILDSGTAPLSEMGADPDGQGADGQGADGQGADGQDADGQGADGQDADGQGASITDPWVDRPRIGDLGSGQVKSAERHRRAQDALSRMPWPTPRPTRQNRVIHGASGRSHPLEDGLELEVQEWLSRIQHGVHGRVGRVMGLVYARGEELAESLSDIGEREEWRQALIDDMLPRLERFMRVQSGAEPVDEWIGLDLLPMIDDLVRLMSRLAADGRGGRLMAERAAVTLTGLLYNDLHDACAREGWFGLMPVVPLATRFDPRMHQSVGHIPLPGLSGMIVEIRKVGLLTPDGEHVRTPAQVIVVR